MAGGKILGSECTETQAENSYLASRLGGNFGLSGPTGTRVPSWAGGDCLLTFCHDDDGFFSNVDPEVPLGLG